MELYDESKEQKKSKLPMIIGICIAILTVITILIIYGIIYLKNSITTIQIDGVKTVGIEELLYIEQGDEGLQVYLPIIKMSEFLGYEGFKGDYKNKSEDKNKCHVISENEIAMFTLESDVLVKISKDSEYEYIKLDKPVFEKEGELYTTIDGIQKAFNVSFSYDESFKNIDIYTMKFLIEYYAAQLKLGNYSTNFNDQKAILEGMIIILENNNEYGVVDIQGHTILENKYESISYISSTSDFLVKSNGKYGIVSKDAKTLVRTVYDEIGIMDNKNGLYVVKQNETYGIINTDGNIIIDPEYKQIGINNLDKYTQNGVENKYILLDEIIPIQNADGLWGLFNLKGEKIADFQYTGIGCESTPVSNSYPAVVVPSVKIIVVQNEQHYNLVTTSGELIFPSYILDSVYLKSNAATEENQFFMTTNDNTKVTNVEQWLENR